MAALLASGITAFPLPWELSVLVRWCGEVPGLAEWLVRVKEGLDYNARHYPFIAYGTDWLAFAHIVIALAFIGPLRDPVRNIWIVHWAMLCCVGIIPLALVCGTIRGIPFGWQCIDCSFGVFGIVPLLLIDHWTRRLQSCREKRKLYEVPVPSTGFTEEAFLFGDEVRFEFKENGATIVAGIRFCWVSAVRRTSERCSTVWQTKDVYDTLVEVVDSPWIEEVKRQTKKWLLDDREYHHYMIYLDSVGCFEFIADSWSSFAEEKSVK
jgi:hypothetical protein